MANILSSDIYNISDTINQIQKRYMDDVAEESLFMGVYGANNEIFSNIMQNAIIAASEYGNEAFAVRAKFEKNILTYAMMHNIEDINAIPATMEVMIGFVEKELLLNMTGTTFVLDKDSPIMIDDIEFHLDYDIIITRNKVNNNEMIYSARYDIQRVNTLSDIDNPYLQPPIYLNIDGDRFVFINCKIRQVENKTIYKKIITSNILENKMIEFEFDSQLASFEVVAKDPSGDVYLIPIFEGMSLSTGNKYCYYYYMDANTIRVKFEPDSYEPKINCDIEIRLKTTKGSGGVFSYKDDIIQGLQSEKINYKNLSIMVKPVTDSLYGVDRKSIDDLRQIIPKEALSRGNITNNKDIENFFNSIDGSRLLFFKRRDNQLERLYYAYTLLKDELNNIIPTNTINMALCEADFDYMNENRYIIKPNRIVEYTKDSAEGIISTNYSDIANRETDNFLYTSPLICIINHNPLSVSYYLDIVNQRVNFKFAYINQNSTIQFISSSLKCRKVYLEGDKYKLNMTIVQNMSSDNKLVEFDDMGNIISSKIKPVLVLHNKERSNYYTFGKIIGGDPNTNQYDVEFELLTSNMISAENRMRIDGLNFAGSVDQTYSYFDESIGMSVYLYVQFDEEYGRDTADTIIPDMEGYTLCNRYDTLTDVHLFYNFSHIIKSTVSVNENADGSLHFVLKGVPLVRYSYLQNVDRCLNFVDYIQFRRVYIDEALKVLEDSFGIDLKYFNTYGPSKVFKIGHNAEPLDKVNLSLTFKVKFITGADKNALDYILKHIKDYVENINVISDIHMTNLTTEVSNKFRTYIQFIEFLGINKYNALYQYLERTESTDIETVPEFLNINITNNLKPDINIIIV